MSDHTMLPPDASDLRWRCSGCDWTASNAFTTPEQRGVTWERRHPKPADRDADNVPSREEEYADAIQTMLGHIHYGGRAGCDCSSCTDGLDAEDLAYHLTNAVMAVADRDADNVPGDRERTYAEAILPMFSPEDEEFVDDLARAVVAVADREQATLRGEKDSWRLIAEAANIRAEKAEAEIAAFRAECDKVGIPYDAAGLVRHHRGNAGMAAANWQVVAEARAEKAEAEVERLRAGLYPLKQHTPESASALAEDIGATEESLLVQWIRRGQAIARVEALRDEARHRNSMSADWTEIDAALRGPQPTEDAYEGCLGFCGQGRDPGACPSGCGTQSTEEA